MNNVFKGIFKITSNIVQNNKVKTVFFILVLILSCITIIFQETDYLKAANKEKNISNVSTVHENNNLNDEIANGSVENTFINKDNKDAENTSQQSTPEIINSQNIIKNEETKIDKNKKNNTSQQSTTEIVNNQNIIKNEESKIDNNKENNTSQQSTTEIVNNQNIIKNEETKIDKVEENVTLKDTVPPIAGTATFQKSDGSTYIPGTWTNQSVKVITINGSDELSGHKYTYSNYSNLTSQGIYKVIITTVDNAGNIATREYEVKIDKTKPTVGSAIFTSKGVVLKQYNFYCHGELIPNVQATSSVLVTTIDGSDTLSGHKSTVSNYSIVMNSHLTEVFITTTDEAGNTAKREYTVYIDRSTGFFGDIPIE